MNVATVPVEVVNTPTTSRYYGVVHAPSIATRNDMPFVFATLQEARDLLTAIAEGRSRVEVRELVGGAIVESTTSFVGAQSEEVEMWLYRIPPAEDMDEYPLYTITRGPRGGARSERLDDAPAPADPVGIQAAPVLASDVVIP